MNQINFITDNDIEKWIKSAVCIIVFISKWLAFQIIVEDVTHQMFPNFNVKSWI